MSQSHASMSVDGLSIVFRSIAPSQAPVNFVLQNRETRRIWDSQLACDGMSEVLSGGNCMVIEGSFEISGAPAPGVVALGVLLKPGPIQGSQARKLLGVDRITTPRIIAIVAPEHRRVGIGRKLVQQLLDVAVSQGFKQVEVEAEKAGHTNFFEAVFHFTKRTAAIRRDFSDNGNHTLYLFDKRL